MIREQSSVNVYKLLILFQCILWGVGTPITRFVYLSITPFCYMVLRFGLATIVFVLFFYKYIKKDLMWSKLKGCILVGFFAAGTYIFANLAVAKSMVTIAGFLMGIPVVFTALFSVIFLKTRLDRRFIAALVMILIGMYLMCCGITGSFAFGIGEFYALMSSVCMAASLMLSAKYIRNVSPATLSTVQCFVTTIVSVFFALALEDFSCVETALPISWVSLLFISLGCTVGSFMLQNISIRHLTALFVSLVFCLQPIFTAIASFFILKETVTIFGIIGGILITIGLIISTIQEEKEHMSSENAALEHAALENPPVET